MKRTTVTLLALFALAAAVPAAPGSMGAGVFLGQPTGLSFGVDMAPAHWLDFKAAWDFSGGKDGYAIVLQGNYEFAFPGVLVIEGQDIVPFVGVGAQLNLSDAGLNLGVHVPFGLDYRFSRVPIELFLEAGLDVYLIPATAFSGSGGLGIRFRF